MNPQVIGADQWDQISRALIYLYLFTGLGITSAISLLLAHAVLPSLVESHDAAPVVGRLRWMAYPLSAGAFALAAYALARGIMVAVQVTQQIYPRTWI
jgi:hypothetical protein